MRWQQCKYSYYDIDISQENRFIKDYKNRVCSLSVPCILRLVLALSTHEITPNPQSTLRGKIKHSPYLQTEDLRLE